MDTKKEYIDILNSALNCVKEVGDLIKNSIGGDLDIQYKGDIDLVTEIDVKVENELKERLISIYKGEFLAEETTGIRELDESPTWIIDPIDGTTNFAHGLPMVATSVALAVNREIVLGIINIPILDECFFAIKGHGAFLNNKKISVSSETNLKSSLIATGFPYSIKEKIDEVLPLVRAVLMNSQGLRRMGAAAIDLAYVACGRFDGFFEQDLKPWDVAAGWLIVEEAGGVVTQYNAATRFNLCSSYILATNGKIHSQLSQVLINSKRFN